MEITTSKSMHPLTAIAAVSLTLFSLAGIGAITGLIPTSHGTPAQLSKAAQEPTQVAAVVQPTPTAAAATLSAPKPAAHKAVAKRPKPAEPAVRPAEEPLKTSTAQAPVMVAQLPPQPAPAIEPAKPVCHDCGVIESVREIEKKGEGSGLGAAVGGVAGGVLGRQTGGGRGRDVMTVLGAIGGAIAGNEIEKNRKKVKQYEIDIRFDDGSSRVITQDYQPAWRMGDRVKLVNGVITASNSY